MTISRKLVISSLSMIAALGLISCEDKMNAEPAGKSIDNAIVKTVSDESVNVRNAVADSAITAKVKSVILAEPGMNVLDICVTRKTMSPL